MPDYVSKTKRGRDRLIFKGYGYVKDKDGPDAVKYWRCEKKDEQSCTGRMRTDGANIVALVGDHCHAPDATRQEVAEVRDRMSTRSRETMESTHQIVNGSLADTSLAACSQLPETRSLKKQCQRERTKASNAPPNPGNLVELQLPVQYTATRAGDDLLLYDNGPDAGNQRMLVFATQANIELLAESDHWYMDGTFKTVPHLFAQLYTIAVKRADHFLPVVYALLPNKMQETYERLLGVVKDARDGMDPANITIDFEKAVINAIEICFPECHTSGCFFHFCQNIYRHVQLHGLQERYTMDADFALQVRQLAALAFVPLGDVVQYFEHLDLSMCADADPLLQYIEQYYIGTRRPNGQRRVPLFPPELWNVYAATIQNEDRTNNIQEGWHRKFASTIAMERKKEQYVAGDGGPAKKKKYVDRDRRLRAIVQSFEDRPIGEFLRGIAHNLAFTIVV